MKDEEIEVDMTALEKELQLQKKKEEEPLLGYDNPEMIRHETTAKPSQIRPQDRQENIYQFL
jgi:hypothetical protein